MSLKIPTLVGSRYYSLVYLNQSDCSSSRDYSSSSHLPLALSLHKTFTAALEELSDALSEPS